LAAMVKIIARAISLANAPMLSEAELIVRAKEWSETLCGIIPEERLRDSFNRAIRDHKGTFAISAYDLKDAWWEVRKDEVKEQSARREQELRDLEMKALQPGFEPCSYCFGCGFRYTIKQEHNGRHYTGVIKCQQCDHWERRMQWSKK